jgi:hypothetical protein
MTHPFEQLANDTHTTRNPRELIILADVCFEMFPIRELRKPSLILDELRAAFPEFNEPDILRAISMALSWRRLLRDAGRPLH